MRRKKNYHEGKNWAKLANMEQRICDKLEPRLLQWPLEYGLACA